MDFLAMVFGAFEFILDVLVWCFQRDDKEWSIGRIVAVIAIIVAIVFVAFWLCK